MVYMKNARWQIPEPLVQERVQRAPADQNGGDDDRHPAGEDALPGAAGADA